MNEYNLGSIKLTQLEKIIQKVKDHYKDEPERLEDLTLSAEFLIISCFPELYKNFENNISEYHTQGYIEGYNDGVNNREKKK